MRLINACPVAASKRTGLTGVLAVISLVPLGSIGLAFGLIRWVSESDAVVRGTPMGSFRSDLRMSMAHMVIYGLVLGAAAGISIGTAIELEDGWLYGLASGVLFAVPGFVFGVPVGLLPFAFGATASGMYLSAVRYLALRRRVPWRLMRFLDSAYHTGLLRQQGACYQFRYPWLRDHFARQHQKS